MIQAGVASIFVRKQGRPFYSPVKRQDLIDLTALIDAGKLRVVVDKTFPLDETAEAMEYVARGHASGKTVIDVVGSSS